MFQDNKDCKVKHKKLGYARLCNVTLTPTCTCIMIQPLIMKQHLFHQTALPYSVPRIDAVY